MDNSFSRIIGLVLPFVAKSLYTKLPPEADEHRSFEIQDDDRLCECIAVPERMLWAIRFHFASKDGTAWWVYMNTAFYDDSPLRKNLEDFFKKYSFEIKQ